MEMLIVLAGITALVYGTLIFVRGGLVAGAACVLLTGICFGHAFYHSGQFTADRLLWGVLVLQYFFWARLAWTDARPLRAGEWLLLAFVGVLAVCTFTHDWQADKQLPVSRLVFLYLMPLGMYWIGWQARLGERGVLGILAGLWCFGLYLAATAIAEGRELSGLVFPPYIMSSEFPEFLGRARGPLLNPAGNGILLGTCLAAVLLSWPRLHRLARPLVLASAALLCAGIYCTLTRSAWMGGCLGLTVLIGLTIPRRYSVAILAVLLCCGALVAVTQWERIWSFKRDKGLDASEAAESAKLRPILATIAWRMFLDRPLLGCGLGLYSAEHVNYLGDRDSELPLEKGRGYVQHNVILSLLTETGLAGAALFVGLLGVWLRRAWQLWKAVAAPLWARQMGLLFLALAANYLVNGMFQDVSIIPMVHMVFFFFAGLTANLHAQHVPAAAGWRLPHTSLELQGSPT